MPGKVKTVLVWLIIAFLVYAVVRDPDRAANVIKAIWDLIYSTIEGFAKFFGSLAT